jgi:hypothetical protein
MFQITEHQVKGDGWSGVTQMRVAIDGGTAYVHAHMWSIQGFERLFAARKAVIDV